MEHPVKIYITADTIISSLGFTTGENMDHIRNYQTGISQINDKNLYSYPFMGGQIDEDCLQKETSAYKGYTHMEQLFLLAIGEVIKQSGVNITTPDCILILSTTKGNINKSLPEMGQHIGDYFGFPASPIIISSACISGVSALIVASRLIREGKYKHAIVAGGDLLSRFVISGFQSFKSVSPEICRPYDKERDGLSLGEACGVVLVTSDKQLVHDTLPIVIEGGAISNDANHISGPSRTGDGLYIAISKAMSENELKTGDISFINAHGTATIYNDEMESKAIHLAGLDDKPVNSLKSYWGHTLGASGIIESIACMEQLRTGELFGTFGFVESNVTYPLYITAEHRALEMQRCLKTASGFGGCNAAIILALENHTKPIRIFNLRHPKVVHTCVIENGKITKDSKTVFKAENETDFASFIRAAYKNAPQEGHKFFKMDNLCKLGYIAAEYLLSEIDLTTYKPNEIGIILSNASASLDTDFKHQQIIDTYGDRETSPAVFVYTLPNVVMGEICIHHKIKGENTFFISSEYNESFIKEYAASTMKHQNLRLCIIGWCELFGEHYKASFELIE